MFKGKLQKNFYMNSTQEKTDIQILEELSNKAQGKVLQTIQEFENPREQGILKIVDEAIQNFLKAWQQVECQINKMLADGKKIPAVLLAEYKSIASSVFFLKNGAEYTEYCDIFQAIAGCFTRINECKG